MRSRAASNRGRVQLVGIDMTKPDVPADTVRAFLRRVDPAWADSLEALSQAITRARRTVGQSVVVQGEFPATAAAGHHVRFSGWIRSQDVSDYTGLWWRADAQGGTIAFDNMERQQVKGTRGWQRYALELDVPAKADHVVFGALMSGRGRAWFDSLGIEIDGKSWSDTSRFDLALESAVPPAGFRLDPGPGYDTRMDDSSAAVGRWSLRLSNVEGFVRPDARQVWGEAERRAARLVRRFEDESLRYRRASSDEEAAWVTRYAHLLLQRTRFSLQPGARDSSHAANFEWVRDRLPKRSRVVLWAHNDEVARADSTMGDWLAKRLGKDMVVIGLATNEGQCTTTRTTSANLEATPIEPGPKGSFEAFAHASGIPRFLLDLRRAEPGSEVAMQLQGGLTLRSIGVATPKQQFRPAALSKEFDVIAWVEKTQGTRRLTMH
jgi:erythromycin esterase-like protein